MDLVERTRGKLTTATMTLDFMQTISDRYWHYPAITSSALPLKFRRIYFLEFCRHQLFNTHKFGESVRVISEKMMTLDFGKSSHPLTK